MGLTNQAVGFAALTRDAVITGESRVIAVAGNPNVGKSTVFNALTGMKQHTGNWPGKTVGSARGSCVHRGKQYHLVDIPGTYSLLAHSTEEEIARDFICFGRPQGVIVVCDATCLERGLNLVLQTLELTDRVVVCVNLMDEAKRKGIELNLELLSHRLGVPVIGTSARAGEGLEKLMDEVDLLLEGYAVLRPAQVTYAPVLEQAVEAILPLLPDLQVPSRWLALRLLEQDESLLRSLTAHTGFALSQDARLQAALQEQWEVLGQAGLSPDALRDSLVASITQTAEQLCTGVEVQRKRASAQRDRRIDRILTGKYTGIPLMLGLLALSFWLTVAGANYPSQMLSELLIDYAEPRLFTLLSTMGLPDMLCQMLAHGAWRVVAWVTAVMLPPMAIFFPLFTLLEDLGYLPRVAFNLDHHFKACHACGKQALTMCMGLGCNAAGVVGCRIIDSPRERLIAILTNNFIPCNGRLPTLIAIITMFFVGTSPSLGQSLLSSLLLTATLVLGVLLTFWTSKWLSKTVLKGMPSSFTLELPPYRRPQIGQVIVRSIFDRTLFVLGRAIVVALPAGFIIWLLANISVGGATLLHHCTAFMDPFARLLGMDGVILMAFILALPANEIVLPIIIMAYTQTGVLVDLSDLDALRQLLISNGWTWVTAVCTMLFSLVHWPCSTTCLTIRKETGSWGWTALSMLLPTVVGMVICFAVSTAAGLFALL